MTDKPTIAIWPRLLSLELAGQYCSVGKRTIEQWIHDQILQPVRMPGALHSRARSLSKILIDRQDLDSLIDMRKAES